METLPTEIASRIFRLLPPKTFYGSLPQVNRAWNTLAKAAFPGSDGRPVFHIRIWSWNREKLYQQGRIPAVAILSSFQADVDEFGKALWIAGEIRIELNWPMASAATTPEHEISSAIIEMAVKALGCHEFLVASFGADFLNPVRPMFRSPAEISYICRLLKAIKVRRVALNREFLGPWADYPDSRIPVPNVREVYLSPFGSSMSWGSLIETAAKAFPGASIMVNRLEEGVGMGSSAIESARELARCTQMDPSGEIFRRKVTGTRFVPPCLPPFFQCVTTHAMGARGLSPSVFPHLVKLGAFTLGGRTLQWLKSNEDVKILESVRQFEIVTCIQHQHLSSENTLSQIGLALAERMPNLVSISVTVQECHWKLSGDQNWTWSPSVDFDAFCWETFCRRAPATKFEIRMAPWSRMWHLKRNVAKTPRDYANLIAGAVKRTGKVCVNRWDEDYELGKDPIRELERDWGYRICGPTD
ncbi:hypothetical protein HDU93_005740 [Gonapodya sp. JEL0774]|nr:hypothetical protein HDU93_005740 [Gonapodya sp. JEL0774]